MIKGRPSKIDCSRRLKLFILKTMNLCPCQSQKEFSQCCEPFLTKKAKPETAEQLMRSRYTAFAQVNVDYLKDTLAPESQKDFDLKETREWSKNAEWRGLQILSTQEGQSGDQKGKVEFVATYAYKGDALDHHETALFRKDSAGQWLFVDGDGHTHPAGETHHHHTKPQTHVREEPKVGRNDPCPCGSGKKYKKCHAA